MFSASTASGGLLGSITGDYIPRQGGYRTCFVWLNVARIRVGDVNMLIIKRVMVSYQRGRRRPVAKPARAGVTFR